MPHSSANEDAICIGEHNHVSNLIECDTSYYIIASHTYIALRYSVVSAYDDTNVLQGLGGRHLLLFLPWMHPLHDARTQRCRPLLRSLRYQTRHVAQQRAYGRTRAWLGLSNLSCCVLHLAFVQERIEFPVFIPWTRKVSVVDWAGRGMLWKLVYRAG